MDAIALFTDTPEVVVVIVGVVELAALAPDDAPCAACALARRLHGVFAVVAALLRRKRLLPIAEDRAILRVGEGPALADRRDRRLRFRGKLRVGNVRGVACRRR